MRNDTAPQPIRLEDYHAPDYLIEHADLSFSLDPTETIVKSRLTMRRRKGADEDAPLVLDGVGLKLHAIAIDEDACPREQYFVDEKTLKIAGLPPAFTLDLTTSCSPEANTALSGLYLSNGMFCTQCEAEGFRRITYFLDRPDVLAKYSVRIEADKSAYPVLLSNGNRTGGGDLKDGRHFAQWADPHPKPAYLFALVGGDLAVVEDAFTTRSGREVTLRIFVQPQNKDKCAYTLDALKRAMRWDEDVFGREYDLDIFMIVAVDHFNFGAMENKGLNIFNSAYVLASPETATDFDYETIESIVAHEYFHNWSGNRVTCRDWFQLCLKEGFTVFRDQEFSSDMRSRPVQRIKDVRRLKSAQFPEDAGPLAHPVRPESYISIDNFYTATVYQKGAELVRMMKILLGAKKFRQGSDLYFARHDGHAATVEDFVKAMEDAGDIDLKHFRRWYSDAGTPEITAEGASDAANYYSLTLSQKTNPTPGQVKKPPRQMPVKFALLGEKTGAVLEEGSILLSEPTETRRFGPFDEKVFPSILRGFSAPCSLNQHLSVDQRLLIMSRETDLFSRWAAADRLWRDLSLAFADSIEMPDRDKALARFTDALDDNLKSASEDPAFFAELLRAPSENDLANDVDIIDPAKIVAGRRHVRESVAKHLAPRLNEIYAAMRSNAPYDPGAGEAGKRTLKNAALSLLVAAGNVGLAEEQAASANNMTDEAAATAALAVSETPARGPALERFYHKWRGDRLVVNKWLAMRAMAPGENALGEIEALTGHEAFDINNPNKVRALIGAFAGQNMAGFHRMDGKGYAFFAEQILAIDKLNPQLAARLTTVFEQWRRLEGTRRALVENNLTRITQTEGLSPNLFEMANRLMTP